MHHPNLPRVTNHFILGSQQYPIMNSSRKFAKIPHRV
jgi:hypothetical protein